MKKRQLEGIIISNKMKETAVVKVARRKMHPKYKKIYNIHKKYKANFEIEGLEIGDKVIIEECRPISKEKRWQIIKKI